MKDAENPMHKCGAKCRTNNNQPCRNYAMKNGRCRMHGGSSTGPKTDQGKKSIAQARTTTGLRTKGILAEKRRCRKLKSDAKDIVEFTQRRIDLWRRMEAGDTEALYDLMNETSMGEEGFL